MKEDDSLEGSYIVGTDMQIIETPKLDIPNGKFTWHSFKHLKIRRQALMVKLQNLESDGILKSSLCMIKLPSGRKIQMRVYEKIITPKTKK